MPCDHVSWLQVTGVREFAVADEGRLKRLIRILPNKFKQVPDLVVFLGKGSQDHLHCLFPQNDPTDAPSSSLATLHLDKSSIQADHPLLFAEVCPSMLKAGLPSPNICHDTQSYPIAWTCPNAQMAHDAIVARALLPFTAVIAIFMDDFSCPEEVVGVLERWATMGTFQPSYPRELRPRLLLIDSSHPDQGSIKTRPILENPLLLSTFQDITCTRLYASIPSQAGYKRLKKSLTKEVFQSRSGRKDLWWLFNGE